MAGVSIKELGLRFVQICMENYWGTCLFWALFVLGLLWSVIRHRKQEPMIFLYYTLFLLLTVYNPVLVKHVIPKIHFENEYYRFFWILPVIPAVAYYAVRLVFSVKNKWGRGLLALVMAGVIIAAGTPLQGVVTDFALAENLYKVPNELRSVCDVIHNDSSEENPSVVFDPELNNVARQYDASLKLILHRDAILYRVGSTEEVEAYENSNWYQRLKVIMDVVYFEMDVPLADFQKVLNKTKTDYLVVDVSMTNHDYLREAGCVPIAQTNEHVIYRFDWESAQN